MLNTTNLNVATTSPEFDALSPEDQEIWKELGITTAAESEHYDLVALASDLSKSVWGRKTAWNTLSEMSTDDLRVEIKWLQESLEAELNREERLKSEELEARAVEARLLVQEHSVTEGLMAELLDGALPA